MSAPSENGDVEGAVVVVVVADSPDVNSVNTVVGENHVEEDNIVINNDDDDDSDEASRPSQLSYKKEGGDAGVDELEQWLKSRQLAKPEDQENLTEAELNEEISKVLTAQNTNIVKNLVVYSYVEREYVPLPPPDNIVTLFSFEGTALHIDSPEAIAQIAEMGEEGFISAKSGKKSKDGKKAAGKTKTEKNEDEEEEVEDEDDDEKPEGSVEGEEIEGGEETEEEQELEVEEEGLEAEPARLGEEEEQPAQPVQQQKLGGGRKHKLINQFNFCERAALTFTYPHRNVETQTIPPPRSTFGDTVLQWVIYDSYAEDFSRQSKEKEKDKKLIKTVGREEIKKKSEKQLASEELNRKYLKCWQILERMINQNIYDEIAQDYRYYEDPADEFREGGEGTLLPLWKFSYEKTRKMNVTELVFNPHYYDLYAACFGSYDFMKQTTEGAICLFTIKNPSFPDYRITTESGVMCCDIHPKYPFLLAIGMYDGNVAVYNLKQNYKDPIYMSQGVNTKHGECVYEIKWAPDMPDGEINFYSVSTDGKVFNWVLMQNRLSITKIITLFLEDALVEGPDGTEIKLKGCGTCMTFHPTNQEIFLVGTEEGVMYKCSTAYSSKYLMTYDAHYLSVYRIDFNKFNSDIFASCGGDWRVKIWEDMRPDPLFIFDLGSSVGDVKWAPYSSTVFAAVTTEGKVYVFDLNVNKYKAICIQAVVPKKKSKLLRLSFNDKIPFIIVGDDKGTITSLKLSPNLRLMAKPPKKQQHLDQQTLQIQKLEKLLSLVRELSEGDTEENSASSLAS